MVENVDGLPVLAGATRKHAGLLDGLRRLVREKPLGAAGGVVILLLLLTGVFADLLAPYDFNESVRGSFLKAPSGEHIFGTDHLGRDLLSRIIHGARISMIVGLSGACLDVLIAMVIGISTGYIGGKFDLIVQRFVDAFMCFPGLILLIILMSLVGSGMTQVIIVLGFVWGIGGSRIVRGAVIGIKENVYVSAAEVIGCSTWRMLFRHIMPNIMPALIIMFTIAVGGLVLAEASLSFLGYGIPPPAPSWGGMLSSEGRYYMMLAPWMVIWPGLALTLVVFSINMLGDAVRDLLDPRLRGGVGRYGGVKARTKAS
jgi:peptide/nickel transport system permease protein